MIRITSVALSFLIKCTPPLLLKFLREVFSTVMLTPEARYYAGHQNIICVLFLSGS